MNHQRSNRMSVPSNGHYRVRLGFAVAAFVLASVSSAVAVEDGPTTKARHAEATARGAPRENESRMPAGFPEGLKKKLEDLAQKETQGTLSDDEKQRLARLRQIKQNFQKREDRVDRAKLLKQKETDGTLTAEEKPELEATKQREARFENLRKQTSDRLSTRQQRTRQAKRLALKELPRLFDDSAAKAEFAKHAERLAKIERARDVASAEQDADTLARLDKVRDRETQRHQAWVAKRRPAANSANQGAKP